MRPGTGLALLGLAVMAPPLAAQAPSGPAGWLQLTGSYHAVSEDFGDWKGVGVSLHAPAGSRTVWDVTAFAQEAFGDDGVWVGAGWRRQWSADWFTYVGAGAGTGEYHLPDLRTDLTIGKSWGNVVTMVGGTWVDAKRGFSDAAVQASLAAYFDGVVVEAGSRANWSHPDAVASARGFAALTLGRERHRTVTLRGSGGTEGYQLTGAVSTERRFTSWEGSVGWREWLGRVGLVGQVELYDNPFYTRSGVTVGVFLAW